MAVASLITARAERAGELRYHVVRKGTPRRQRRAMRFAARRVNKRVASCTAGRLGQLGESLRDEWRRQREPQPSHNDGWVMRTLGFLFLWGDGADILGVA